jgi:hypothetical protein
MRLRLIAGLDGAPGLLPTARMRRRWLARCGTARIVAVQRISTACWAVETIPKIVPLDLHVRIQPYAIPLERVTDPRR